MSKTTVEVEKGAVKRRQLAICKDWERQFGSAGFRRTVGAVCDEQNWTPVC